MFPLYYMDGEVISKIKSPTTQRHVIHCEKVQSFRTGKFCENVHNGLLPSSTKKYGFMIILYLMILMTSLCCIIYVNWVQNIANRKDLTLSLFTGSGYVLIKYLIVNIDKIYSTSCIDFMNLSCDLKANRHAKTYLTFSRWVTKYTI